VSDIREEILFSAGADDNTWDWQSVLEEKERLAQLHDEEVARQFWAYKYPDRLI
jgi:hypothetical protein